MIEILNYERVNKNKVIGLVDISLKIEGLSMIIRKITHMQSGDKRWFNLPNFTRERPNQLPQYLRYWQFETEVHNGQLLEMLSEKVKDYCEKNNIPEVALLNFDSKKAPIPINDLPF